MRVTERKGVSQTGRVLDRMAKDAGQWGYRESLPQLEVDEADGDLVEKARRKCTPTTKELLKWLFVFNAHPSLACRKMKIPFRPREIFDQRRRAAESEITRHLEPDRRDVRARPPA